MLDAPATLAALFLAFASPNSNAEVSVDLSGEWRHVIPNKGSKATIRITQKGKTVRGVWLRRVWSCIPGNEWFAGELRGRKVLGERYLCSGGTDSLNMTVDETGNRFTIDVETGSGPDTDMLERAN
jgi:hypothetical protein